ncbi:hypothetical protein [Paraburkholderia sp. J12]|uniref:hypothetical protein n=1 Tax=Paraburkholderia sp. J12 TaxID=2805432 RepID=UPI002ABD2375|nr:hypothetical protein [Paraburkholderia sp. J12]
MAFDAERAARLADELQAELDKLGVEPDHLQRAGGVLTCTKWLLTPLARNLRSGLYGYLEPGAECPAWLRD